MACPSSCSDITLLPLPPSCGVVLRKNTLARLLVYPCSFELPDPIICGEGSNIQPLFDDGTIVISGKLANIVLADPVTEDVTTDDCTPVTKNILTREITFEDRNAVSIADPSFSPGYHNLYYDYDWWLDKIANNTRIAWGIVFCNGDVIIPRDVNGQILNTSVYTFISYQKSSTVGGQSIEFKKGSLTFQGDPFNFQRPDFNLVDCGIEY